MSVKYLAALSFEMFTATRGIPQIVVERVVHHHPDEAAHHDGGIDFDQRSFALALTDVPPRNS
jgi:hypothetical protein